MISMTIMTKITLMAMNSTSNHRDEDDHTDDKSYSDGCAENGDRDDSNGDNDDNDS